ncbi:unnamed protein product [Phytophthora lilii]|uniref:Unnamed protein product n=1 Tax=Phytophthora lilii TaxID=2077276 RepID=A0A9W6U130_9STRA|nr:unnamed protein product [Phytophthora lilii]
MMDTPKIHTEEKPNLALAVAAFKQNNPDWSKIRVVMTDKALHEKDVLKEAWPNARQLLCRWHVETWLKRQCSLLGGLGKRETKTLKAIMEGLVNAESQQQYDDLKDALLESLGNDKEHHLFAIFMHHWDTSTDEWVMFKRGGVPHLMNHTNNRLESKWGRIKEVVDGNFTVDELVSMLITLQDFAEERYLAEFHRVGSRPPISEDRELTAVAMQLSDYAFMMVEKQYKLAMDPRTSYDIEMRDSSMTLRNPSSGGVYEVDARLTEKITDVISIQPSTTYRLAMKWLKEFHTALHSGKLDEFTGLQPPEATDSASGFPRLSQISVPDSLTISQLSFAEPNGNLLLDFEEKASAPVSPRLLKKTLQQLQLLLHRRRQRHKVRLRLRLFLGHHQSDEGPEKKYESRKEIMKAKSIMRAIHEGKKARAVKLSHMELLTGPYNTRTAKPIVNKLELPPVEVTGTLVVRGYNIGQPVPVIKATPQAEKITQAIKAIEDTHNLDMLARWGDYGCATYDQLKLTEAVVTARNNFDLVAATTRWIEKVTWRADNIPEPFKDTVTVTKVRYQKHTETVQKIPKLTQCGVTPGGAHTSCWRAESRCVFEVIAGCEQKDSSSSGLWCLVVVEFYFLALDPRPGAIFGMMSCTTLLNTYACGTCTKLLAFIMIMLLRMRRRQSSMLNKFLCNFNTVLMHFWFDTKT